MLSHLKTLYTEEELHEARNINYSSFKRRQRLKARISKILDYKNPVFLTLTFRPEVLANTTSETRRRYVSRYLKEQTSFYVGNIDFGEENETEHYHAVVCNRVDIKKWTYGNLDVARVHSPEDYKALASYIDKLTNHAIKETTKQSRVIYSRK